MSGVDTAGPNWADVYAESGIERSLDIDNDGNSHTITHHISGGAIRIVSARHDHFLQFVDPDDEVRTILRNAASSIPGMVADQLLGELAHASEIIEECGTEDEKWFDAGRELLSAARAAALAVGISDVRAQLWSRRRCWVSWREGDRWAQDSTLLKLAVTARHGSGRGFAVVADLPAAPLTIAGAARTGDLAARRAIRAENAIVPDAGDRTVVLAPEPAAIFVHEVVGHALEGDVAPASALWALRGQAVTNTAVTIVDDPRDPWCWDRADRDDEGTACRPAELITAGRVAGVMTDRVSAARLGVGSTGHARRGVFSNPPVPRMRHTSMSAGPDPADDVVGDTRHGILVRAVDSADAIPGQGRFALRVLDACEIVNGRPGRQLAGFGITGGLDEFRQVDAVGDDPVSGVSMCGRQGRWLPVSHTAPTLRLPRLTVRGRAVRP
jgi:predicted Zn-dependent protease